MNHESRPEHTRAAAGLQSFGFDSENDWLVRLRRATSGTSSLGRFGEFELLEEAGRGGQGVVYKAVDPRTKRVVALKRLSAGAFATPSMRARFEREIEAAANLDHPCIVAVYGCESIDGQAVLALQWVEGRTIDRWVSEGREQPRPRKLGRSMPEPLFSTARPIREVLELFLEVCDAVHHAHQRGVIHRDLKPGNILVDRQGQPHVLDFGLAKLCDEAGSSAPITLTGEFLGTPLFAAPEQARGDHAAVDIRTDVYALGAVLYLALTARPLFQPSNNLAQVLEQVQLHEPPPPSVYDARLDHEIDAILLKALAKEKELRYASVDALRADIQRYLAGDAVLAHAPSRSYRVRKFVRKHRVGVASAMAFALMLTGATVVTALLYARSEANARAALQEAEQSRAITDLMKQWLTATNPRLGNGRELRVRDLLRLAAARLDQGGLRTDIRRTLRSTLGESYNSLGMFEEAVRQFEDALAEIPQDAVEERLPALAFLAEATYQKGDFTAAAALIDELQRLTDATLGPDDPSAWRARVSRGRLLHAEGEFEQAEQVLRAALGGLERVLPSDDPDIGEALNALAIVCKSRGNFVEAAGLLQRAVEIADKRPERDPVLPLMRRHNLASVLLEQDKPEESERISTSILPRAREILGDHHPVFESLLNTLATAQLRLGRREDARKTFEEAIAAARSVHGENHANVALLLNNIGHLLDSLGDSAGALVMMDRALAIRRGVLPPNHPELAWSLYDVAWMYVEAGRAAEAEPMFRESVEIFRGKATDALRDEALGGALSGWGNCLLVLGRAAEAIAPLEQSLAIRTTANSTDWRRFSTERLLASCYLQTGDTARGGPMLLAAVDQLLAAPDTPASVRTRATHAAIEHLERIGDVERAAAYRSKLTLSGP